jgi:hypothetical protein
MIPENIKLLIENRFGRRILYSKDCEALAVSIKRACNATVSSTTLKRIFGFAKSIERPRLYTLDILAKYLNFSDWGSLLNSTPNIENRLTNLRSDNTHSIQQQFIIMMMTGIIEFEKVENLCIRYGACDEIINFIIDLIIFAGKSKNVLFLKQVFNLPIVFDTIIENPKLLDIRLYFIGQSVGMALRSDADMAAQLTKTYGKNAVAQVILIEWFVDEDYINGYYGDLLEVYFKNKPITNETRIFYFALKYTQAKQNNHINKQAYWARKIKNINLSKETHAILIGRYIGICLAEDKNHFFEKSFNLYSFISDRFIEYNYIQKTYLILFSFRYLFANKKNEWLVKFTKILEFEIEKEKIFQKNFWEMKIDNQLLIYLAYTKYLTGNTKLAKECLNKIDLNLFDVFRYSGLHKDFSEVQSILKKTSKTF